ncbi:MAG: pirin family protein [Geothrix sp.]|uniref:pirin family protein n=1 Tax=Geothrix sp. TaxID=1962974 RepID=UPI00185A2E18|nr:pirin family protein [Geothrix sp.]NWJ39675.1 pirin family protein [Geothrix sp.]WIL22306.1 MAG: pirin family protein [Geothrix sp.]
MSPKPVASLVTGLPTQDGNRVPLVRLVPGRGQHGTEAFRAMDPFLLMDHFGPMVLPPGTDAGFPPHPHRGFQTLTYLIQGAFKHRDSTGGSGLLRPGGAQLMNAGAGIVHEEMPVPEHLETGGPIEGVQLWINLPKADKWSQPGYTDLQPESMPWTVLPGGRIRVLAGSWAGVTGPARTPARIAYAHLELAAGGRFQQTIPEGWTAAVVPLHGSVRLEGTEVPADTVALLGNGESLALEALTPVSLMLLAGEPLREPIAHYGPFVMNTREELEQAVLDYQQGRMGHLD